MSGVDIPIDHGHDYYKVDIDQEYAVVTVELWSRGTFGVNLRIPASDIPRLTEALTAAAKEITEDA